MRTVKFLLIFICLFVYLIMGFILRLALMRADPHVLIRVMNLLKYYLMHAFKRIAGLRVTVSGNKDILKERGLFIISTHIGYIDGIILGTLVPGSFITKEEIKNIPFIGGVVSIGGSIFIDRREKAKIIQYVNLMADRLKHKINIFNFPEGHATDGTKILSFFPAFFDAPLKAKSPIIPVTIDYEKADGKPILNRDDIYCYEGKVSILKHLWNLLKFKSVDVAVDIHDKIETGEFGSDRKGRKFVSDLCIKRLSAYKNLPVAKDHPFQKPSIPSPESRSTTIREF